LGVYRAVNKLDAGRNMLGAGHHRKGIDDRNVGRHQRDVDDLLVVRTALIDGRDDVPSPPLKTDPLARWTIL
jgi:hypothetical protein